MALLEWGGGGELRGVTILWYQSNKTENNNMFNIYKIHIG